MPFNLTIEEIRKSCGTVAYQRGLRYQRQGQVISVAWSENSQSIIGEVHGSSRNRYRQQIQFTTMYGRRLQGDCSCPVTYNCKHVVAVLLQWIEQHLSDFEKIGKKQLSALQEWQKTTVHRLNSATTGSHPVPGDICILYVLKPRKFSGKQMVELEAVKSRRLKQGGWGKSSHFSINLLSEHNSHYYGYNPRRFILPIDLEIGRLLNSQTNDLSATRYLQGDIGLLVLQRLLQSGRCFFNSLNISPLILGSQREISFRWEEAGACSHLQTLLDGKASDWLLLPTKPVWYLDTLTLQCGLIDQPLTTPALESLLTIPPVPSSQLYEISSFLIQTFHHKTIPLPVELALEIIDQPPTPTLLLHSIVGPEGHRHHLARLRFEYEKISLPPYWLSGNKIELLHRDEQQCQIHRHCAVEHTAVHDLISYYFVTAEGVLATKGELDLFFLGKCLTDSALGWKNFLEQVPQLQAAGWKIIVDDSFAISFETSDYYSADIHESNNDWFEFGLNIIHDGHKIPLLPLLTQWLENDNPDQPLLHLLGNNRWLEIPCTILTPVLDILIELSQGNQLNTAGSMKLPRSRAHSLLDIEDQLELSGQQLLWQGSQHLRQLAEKLKNFRGINPITPPPGLIATLRQYQLQGLAWLQFLREYHFNGVLADDMGLGKTIQTLSHLLLEKDAGRLDCPALIVAPTSVLSNWQREAGRFTPDLNCLVHHGPLRDKSFTHADKYDVIITSYALLARDLTQIKQHQYHFLILDEAQAIKNPNAKTAQAARHINTRHRLCLTGTPLENHLGELWSLFHFLMPGFLGNQKFFTQLFRTPIEKHQNRDRQEQLQKRIAPFVLRRNKDQVAVELPPKTLMIREAELGSNQAALYESLRLAMVDKVTRLLENKGLERGHIEILDALLKLRQACCDPRLVKLESARKVKQSAKLDTCLELLEKLLSENRKILVFSQFTSMLRLIEDELQTRNINYTKLTGQTRNRDAAIADFQEGSAAVFLISLKAGGVGLNLTAADTVIHYDPWWNPAVENQATDRAHRIGQQKPVFVYKLIAKGTIEEKILQLQEKKQKLADAVYHQDKESDPLKKIAAEDILNLLEPIAKTGQH